VVTEIGETFEYAEPVFSPYSLGDGWGAASEPAPVSGETIGG